MLYTIYIITYLKGFLDTDLSSTFTRLTFAKKYFAIFSLLYGILFKPCFGVPQSISHNMFISFSPAQGIKVTVLEIHNEFVAIS